MKGFPTPAAAEFEGRPRGRRSMVEALWSEQGIDIVVVENLCHAGDTVSLVLTWLDRSGN